ncbi:peroxiredoxin [Sodalis-like secondary symbiont of Drepanosiphum platanoidis]|uniref:peroxiredoxin n=1 Tax=Sodalis-like secondary symbiont of Drepanosiphum platanoidis TaxID=2994493 RepID=UPI003463D7A0
MILVTKNAPDFTSSAILNNGKIIEDFNLKNYIKNKYAIIFFWPMDFTFVCPSEIIAFNNRYLDFKNRNIKIVGISCDSVFVHNAWKSTSIKNGGIGKIFFPMVSDIKHEIINSYGIAHPKLGIALRGSFIIDKKNIIRHQSINDLPIGRNVNEIIRIIDALKFHEKNKKVCPAQWEKNSEGMEASIEGVKKYLSKNYKNI